jgi:hypothetical protein
MADDEYSRLELRLRRILEQTALPPGELSRLTEQIAGLHDDRTLRQISKVVADMEAFSVEFSGLLPARISNPSRGGLLELVKEVRKIAQRNGPREAQKRKRGRPTEIPEERKEKALAMKEAGEVNRAIAAVIYDCKRPTLRQCTNVPSILNAYKKKRDRQKDPSKK